jgi:iron complex outermembrane receptor protein
MKQPASRSVALFLGACGVALAFAWSASAQTAGHAKPGDQSFTQVQEIVVTAQKREESLQKVPVSITALTTQAITNNRIQTLGDLSALAPNLSVRLGAGGNQSPNYTLRGVFGASSAPGQDKGVSPYFDGVYLQAQSGSLFELGEIERVEVLKGPQGTLFGRNATGGAISIITRDPTGRFGGHEDLTAGNLQTFRSKTHIELGSWGPLSASFTYLHSEYRGDVRNLGAGTVWNYGPATGGTMGVLVSPHWLGSDNTNAIQAAVKFVMGNFTAVNKYDYTHDNYTPNAMGLDFLPPSFLTQLYAASPYPMTPITMQRPGAVNDWFNTPGVTENWGDNLTMRYRFNDVVSIKDILAYRQTFNSTTYQLDGLGGLINAPIPAFGGFSPGVAIPFSPGGNPHLFAPNPTHPLCYICNNAYQNEHQWSNEFQLNVNTKWMTLTAGLLYFYDHIISEGFAEVYNENIIQVLAGQNTPANGTPFVIPRNPSYGQAYVGTVSQAAYIQPEFHLTPQLDLVLGGRITHDKKNGLEYLPDQQIASGMTIPNPPVTSPIHYSHTQLTYLVGLNYRINDDVMTYVKFSTGYVSGGSLATVQYKPETAASWEGGIKSELFDRRLRSDLAIFWVSYKNIQDDTGGTLTGNPATFGFSQAVINQGDAKAGGFELENTFVPFKGVTLTGNVGYTNFYYVQASVPQFLKNEAGLPGLQPFSRPKFTGTIGGQYESPDVGWRGAHWVAAINANFSSETLLTTFIADSTGKNIDPDIVRTATEPFTWIVNARVALANIDLGPTRAEIALWGKNLLNERQITTYVPLGPIGAVIYQRALTFGLDLNISF